MNDSFGETAQLHSNLGDQGISHAHLKLVKGKKKREKGRGKRTVRRTLFPRPHFFRDYQHTRTQTHKSSRTQGPKKKSLLIEASTRKNKAIKKKGSNKKEEGEIECGAEEKEKKNTQGGNPHRRKKKKVKCDKKKKNVALKRRT